MPTKKDAEREDRIMMEAIVDANGPEEQAMGWYYYLDDKITFPFDAACIAERSTSPLRKGAKVEILGMAPESECEHEMFVEIQWDKRTLAIPLAQIAPVTGVDANTKEAIEDWHYWVKRGYGF